MFESIVESISETLRDDTEFVAKVRALTIGVVRDCEPARLYVVRIDNWFGPKWMHFAGKFSVGKGAGFGVHKTTLHVPPFVPHRVVAQRVLVAPAFEETGIAPPLHIECPSKQALQRRIADIDKDAAFVWFSGQSEAQKRGSIMVYLPIAFDPAARRQDGLRGSGAFYVGFSQREMSWEPAMLRGVSRGEVQHLEESGRATLDAPVQGDDTGGKRKAR